MKNSFLVLGVLLVLINTSIGIIFSAYKPFNMVMANVSILLSTALIYGVYKSAIFDGFKIGFTMMFAITGLIRLICAIVSAEQFKDNFAFLIFIILLAVEGLCFFVANGIKNK